MSDQPAQPPVDTDTRIKVLMVALGGIDGIYDHLDDLRFYPRGSHGAVVACAGVGDANDTSMAFDYNIEMAQRDMENAVMRLQQCVALADPDACVGPFGCSDERGPCRKHA